MYWLSKLMKRSEINKNTCLRLVNFWIHVRRLKSKGFKSLRDLTHWWISGGLWERNARKASLWQTLRTVVPLVHSARQWILTQPSKINPSKVNGSFKQTASSTTSSTAPTCRKNLVTIAVVALTRRWVFTAVGVIPCKGIESICNLVPQPSIYVGLILGPWRNSRNCSILQTNNKKQESAFHSHQRTPISIRVWIIVEWVEQVRKNNIEKRYQDFIQIGIILFTYIVRWVIIGHFLLRTFTVFKH